MSGQREGRGSELKKTTHRLMGGRGGGGARVEGGGGQGISGLRLGGQSIHLEGSTCEGLWRAQNPIPTPRREGRNLAEARTQ